MMLLFALGVSFLGCKKKSNAGFGGNANVKLVAKHHGLVIDSATFYVKFNATDAPMETEYDHTTKGITVTAGTTYGSIKGLKKGDYYFFARGWDPSISNEVKGGIPYTINEETEIELVLPVTEIH